jgi:tRNA(His) 5'-end guanylyltransferase
MKDDLGERIKNQYEDRTRYFIPRRTYTIIRLDGKSFHTYTRRLQKPFDDGLIKDMDAAIIAMLPHIQGVQFAYTQSDEISLLLTDFATPNTDAWFDGNIQKMVSVASSIITAEFNKSRLYRFSEEHRDVEGRTHLWGSDVLSIPLAYFDARVFTIPDHTEVMNYFIWRGQDAARNSVSMVAQSLFSHKELQNKSTFEMQEMMFQKHNVNWSEYDQAKKNGRIIVKEQYQAPISEMNDFEFYGTSNSNPAIRTRWVSKPAWKFTEDKEKLITMIPKYE